MRVETTVSLPDDLLSAIDDRIEPFGGRFGFIEAAVRAFIAAVGRPKNLDAHDREILDRFADELNEEAEDALSYQVPM